MAVPTRQTSEAQLNQFNAWLKQQPWYQQFFASRGKDMNRVELSRGEQGQLESLLAQNGVRVPDGMHIDQAGNLNQKNRLARNIGIGAGLTAAALGTMGAAGAGPLAGMFGGGGGVGAAGMGSGLNAASAGAAAHAGSPLMMGSGALTPLSSSIPTLTSLTGAPIVAGGTSAVPTLAADTWSMTGMGTTPSVFGPSAGAGRGAATAAAAAGGAGASAGRDAAAAAGGAGASRSLMSRLGEGVAESGTDRLLNAAFAALAGLPAMMRDNGPSEEERGFQSQATRLLGQQEQRTQFQNPLYEAVTKMAHGLLPTMGNGGQPYPIGGLSDVKVPGLEDLIRAQRRT